MRAVLIVEDQDLIRDMLAFAFEEAGFEPLLAASAAEGSAFVHDDAQEPCALITDINLGADVNGWDLARAARSLRPELPVVYITGDSAAEWPVQGVPGSTLVCKPFIPSRVVAAVADLLTPDGGRQVA